jgi:hypothetical protein
MAYKKPPKNKVFASYDKIENGSAALIKQIGLHDKMAHFLPDPAHILFLRIYILSPITA